MAIFETKFAKVLRHSFYDFKEYFKTMPGGDGIAMIPIALKCKFHLKSVESFKEI